MQQPGLVPAAQRCVPRPAPWRGVFTISGFTPTAGFLAEHLLGLLGDGGLRWPTGWALGRLPLARWRLGRRRGGAGTRLGYDVLPGYSLLCRAAVRGRFPYHIVRLTLTRLYFVYSRVLRVGPEHGARMGARTRRRVVVLPSDSAAFPGGRSALAPPSPHAFALWLGRPKLRAQVLNLPHRG